MNNFKIAKAWLWLCVLLLTVFVTIPTVASPRNVSSSPNLENSEVVSTFTDLFGTSTSLGMNSDALGNTASSVPNLSALQSNLVTLQSTLQSPPLHSTSLLSSSLPDLAPAILTSQIGSLGTIKAMMILILIFVVVSIILYILCLAIIVRRFLPILKYMCLKTCYPTLSDPSKRLSTGQPIPNRSLIYKIEKRCSRLLFGPANLNL